MGGGSVKKKWLGRMRDDSFSIFHAVNQDQINRLLKGQLFIGAIFVAAVALMELAMYFVAGSEGFLTSELPRYMRRYFWIPTGINLGALLAALAVRRCTNCLRAQAYVNCTLYVCFAFVLYSVHRLFGSLVLCFAIPILMTVVFGDGFLTSFIAGLCIVLKLISDAFISWDPAAGVYMQTAVSEVDVVISLATLAAVYAIALQAIGAERMKHRNAVSRELERLRLYEESITDPMTGIHNLRGLHVHFLCLEAGDAGEDYTLVMMDLDRFKEINDRYGHPVGDRYLKQFAALIDAVPDAEAFRYGGDEFCLVLHGYDREAVAACCRKIQAEYEQSEVCRRVAASSASFGAAAFHAGMELSEWVRRADAALYRAKRSRDSAVFYEEEFEDEGDA